MTKPQKPDDGKIDSLKRYGAFNPHPQKVREKMFSESGAGFFDSRDLVQVKYEMLRAVEKENLSVRQASDAFGFSRPAFYQVQLQFKQEGVIGLAKKRPGPKISSQID